MTRLLLLGATEVQRDAVEVAHELGLEVSVAAADPGPASRLAGDFHQVSLLDVEGVERTAREVAADVVYSVGSDRAMPTVAEVSCRLGLPTLVQPRTAVDANDKGAMRRRLQGRPGQLAYGVVDGPALPPGVRLPCVVKPTDSQGQRGVALVRDEQALAPAVALARTFSRDDRAMVEEYAEGPEVSVNGYLRGGELEFVGVSDRVTHPDHLGLVQAHRFPAAATDPRVDEQLAEVLLASALGLGLQAGPVYAQLKVTADGPRLIEVTPRLDGCHLWRLWRSACGADLLRTALQDLLDLPGRAPLPRPDRSAPGVWRIDFDLLPPGSTMGEDAGADLLTAGATALHRASYYAPGDVVRALNGHQEKVAYRLVHEATGA